MCVCVRLMAFIVKVWRMLCRPQWWLRMPPSSWEERNPWLYTHRTMISEKERGPERWDGGREGVWLSSQSTSHHSPPYSTGADTVEGPDECQALVCSWEKGRDLQRTANCSAVYWAAAIWGIDMWRQGQIESLDGTVVSLCDCGRACSAVNKNRPRN